MVYKINGVPKEAKAVKYPKPRSGVSVRVDDPGDDPADDRGEQRAADGKIDRVEKRSQNLQLTKKFLVVTQGELIQLARELGGKKAGLEN